jgi:hypothetical protein
MRATALKEQNRNTRATRAARGADPVRRSVPLAPVLQRKSVCACGGACPRCRDEKSPLQAKLAVSQPGDAYEREADRVAEQVMRMPAEGNSAPSKGESDSGAPDSVASEIVLSGLGPGRPLDSAARNFFEPRFDRDFSDVRVHDDARAAESARSVAALAYTVGSHVVFAAGRHAPYSSLGRHLLAHELAHVASPADGALQRAPDPDTLKQFDDRVAALRALPAFKAVKGATAKKELKEIIDEARKRDNALYYIEKLELLFTTPEQKSETQAAEYSADISGAAAAESARLATPMGQAFAGREEDVSKEPGRVWTKREGEAGKKFLIDARDVTDIAVRVKVRLVAQGKGKKEDVANVEQLEDSIEKAASTFGYSVDLDFVKTGGPDVFTVGVDTSGWTTSGNWTSEGESLAHELHHLLGLDDLYDYIEAHAGNPYMKIPDRIHWFREQMKKSPEPMAGISIMGETTTGGRNLPSDEDVCRVTGASGAAFDACVKTRSDARRAALQPALSRAFVLAYRAFEILSDMRPENPAEDPQLRGLKRKRAALMVENVLGEPMAPSDAAEKVGDLRAVFALPNLFPVSALDPRCSDTAFTVSLAPRIRICPDFFLMLTEDQADLLLREAAHFLGLSDGTGDFACPASGCGPCGDSNNAEAWARLVKCLANIR